MFSLKALVYLIIVSAIIIWTGQGLVGEANLANLVASFGGMGEGTFQGCTWAPDYYFASCVEYGSVINTYPVSHVQAWQCPYTTDVHQCIVDGYERELLEYPHIYSYCDEVWYGLDCKSDQGAAYVGKKFGRSFWIAGGMYKQAPTVPVQVSIKTERQALMRCGSAGCEAGGEIIAGADGCSWNPGIDDYIWADGTEGAKSIPFGTGYRYVVSQHLLSCPSWCDNHLLCSMPRGLRHTTVTYQGQLYNAYCSDATLHIVGCKTQKVCIKVNALGNECVEWADETEDGHKLGECGTISTQPAGQCCQDSDCGRPDYYCAWENNQGICKPFAEHECDYDYNCSQVGSGCFDRKLSTIKCENYICRKYDQDVQCCTSADCQSGYFCDAQGLFGVKYTCHKSQREPADCPYECCDATFNAGDDAFKNKPCTIPGKTVCCPEHVCKESLDKCKEMPPWDQVLMGILYKILQFIGIFVMALIVMFIAALVLYVIPQTRRIGRIFFSGPGILMMLIGALVIGILFTPFLAQLAVAASLI